MKYAFLLWAGLWRKPLRTALTMLSVAIAFLLFGLLEGFNQGLGTVVDNLNANRLYVLNKIHMTTAQPLSYMNRISSVPGITNVAHLTYFGGFFREAKNPIPAFAVNVEEVFAVFPEFKIDRQQLRAMTQQRSAAIIGKPLAEQWGWKVGQTVHIGTSIWTTKRGTSDWAFEIVGIYEAEEGSGTPPNFFLINYDYFDELRALRNGYVHNFVVRISDPQRATAIARQVDEMFANSSSETRTQSERAVAQTQLKQIGDLGFIVNSIVGAVLFTLLFLTGNTMTQSVRERTPEIAVLKTLGFSDAKVLGLVLLEAVLLCVGAALVGLFVAKLLLPLASSVIGGVQMAWGTLLLGLGAALLVALLSGFWPAYRAQRLNIVDALAGRGWLA